ncbi:response regulator transcription factor [Nitrosophilus alvini]|uniref:response regulator transcription factor n=1 Tax=Nitrosophilus alvini TaxID=2714855 RepID=UPI00190D452C|nr:response regulator transcription factor [Nitrosophilus alvini]
MENCKKLLKELSLLYVEDEKNIRELLKDVLSGDFKNFYTASDAQEGMEIFMSKKPDIVVTDIEMPGTNGLEFAKEIKQISKNTPVLLLTAYSEKERLFKAIDVGVNKYLVKPFTPEKLLDVLCEIAEGLYKENIFVNLGEGFVFDMKKRELLNSKKEPIILTKKELLFVELLAKNLGRVVTIEEIRSTVWQDDIFTEAALRALVKRVRQKSSKTLIKNFPGIGYKIKE